MLHQWVVHESLDRPVTTHRCPNRGFPSTRVRPPKRSLPARPRAMVASSSSSPASALAGGDRSSARRCSRRCARASTTPRGAYASGAASEDGNEARRDEGIEDGRASSTRRGSRRANAIGSSLERQIAVTTQLREEFESDPFLSRSSLRTALAPNVEYNNDVHAVRGSTEYGTLMGHFGDATSSALKRFKFVTRRASSIEPGVLLIQWTAEWDGVTFGKKLSNLLLSSMHEGAVQKLVEGASESAAANESERRRDMKCRLFGRTTYKVNPDGMIVSRLDRVDFRTDPEPGSQSEDMPVFVTPAEEEQELERLAEETAVNMFYNTLCPPEKNETSWFLDVLIELEWQSFQRQMGDTTSVISREEYVNVVYAVIASAIAAPIFFFVGLTLLVFSPDQGTDPNSLDAAFTAAPLTGANGSPLWGADVFLDLYNSKIGV